MEISIIMPVYNAGKYLKMCIESITRQSFHDWECIFINDNSSDDSLSICQSFVENDKRFKLHSNDVNQGPGVSRNIGLDMATGKYVTFVDSDDLLVPCYLSALHKAAKTHNSIAAVCFCDHIDEQCSEMPVRYTLLDEKKVGESFVVQNYGSLSFNESYGNVPWRRLIRRDFLLKNDLYFGKAERGEDSSWCLLSKMIMPKYVSTDISLYLYRKGHSSLMSKNNTIQYLLKQEFINYEYKYNYIIHHIGRFVNSQDIVNIQLKWLHVLLRNNVKACFPKKIEYDNFVKLCSMEYPNELFNTFQKSSVKNRLFSLIYTNVFPLEIRRLLLKTLVYLGL